MGAGANETVFRLQTPHGICVGIALAPGLDSSAESQLLPEERAFAYALQPRRRRTWVGGRLALQRALAAVGAPRRSLLATARGAPVVPTGFVGSISHKDTLAVGLAEPYCGRFVGVDVEMLRPARPAIAKRVLTPEELEALASERDTWLGIVARFSLKEALYKALDPYVNRYVGYKEVAVNPAGGGAAEVRLQLDPATPGLEANLWWELTEEVVLATAAVRRSAP